MSYFLRSVPISRIQPEPQTLDDFDHFDLLPDSLLFLIFNKVADVKYLGRCSIVCRRFHSLVPFVENVLVRVDCVIPDYDSSVENRPFSLNAASMSLSSFDASSGDKIGEDIYLSGVTHHSPTQVLKNFAEIRFLKIELPTSELKIDDGNFLKWRADFGSAIDNCVILSASSATRSDSVANLEKSSGSDENINITESVYINGGFKIRNVWAMSSVKAASARHYLLQPIITELKRLDHLVISDADGQGVLTMNKEQLEELRGTPLLVSSIWKRTLLPELNLRMWYEPRLDLPDGTVLKAATLVDLRPSLSKKDVCDASWFSNEFEEPFGIAAKMLLKKNYFMELSSC